MSLPCNTPDNVCKEDIMENVLGQCILYLGLLAVLSWPLGRYMARIMDGEPVCLERLLKPCERGIYRLLGVDPEEDMDWKRYLGCVLAFSVLSLVALTLLLMLQHKLPLNPEDIPGSSWHLAFNTAASFVTNTNWQAYSGESAMGYLAQAAGLTVQNFLSAAVGIAVLFAFIRGLRSAQSAALGNFWRDATRATLYIMLPLCLVMSLLLVWQGVPQNIEPYKSVALLEPITLDDGSTITEQLVPMGPQASQVAPKQLGTNGGGFNGVNSAHPHENPTPLSNLLQMLALLLIPAGLCFTFGRNVRDMRQGVTVFLAMFVLLTASLAMVASMEQLATPQIAQSGQVDIAPAGGAAAQAGGNMEGKETRFGIAASSTWATFTTAASNGSVNAMHDSFTPLGGLVPTLLMQLGEVVFGGVGCGLYGMLAFVVLTVFLAGLMVGRTPEYLGKKIEPFEMKMAMVICLSTPVVILISSALLCLVPDGAANINNPLPHGFSEILYACSSAGGNNGSAFAGFNANTPFTNVLLGLVMLAARFAPIAAILAMAGSLGSKKITASSAGTLSTANTFFAVLLIAVVLLVGALSFFPALALGPVAEHLNMLR